MSITVTCPSCRNQYATHEKHAGRLVTCKQCGQSMQIPRPDAASRAAWQIAFTCERCGKTYVLSSTLAGKKMVCTKCGLKSRIPAGALGVSVSPEALGTLKPVIDPGSGLALQQHSSQAGWQSSNTRIEPPPTLPSIPAAPQESVVKWDSDPELEPLTADNPLIAPVPVAKAAEPKPDRAPKVEEKPKRVVQPEIDLYGFHDPVPAPVPAGVDPAAPSAGNPVLGESNEVLPLRLGEYQPMSESQKKHIRKRADRLEKMRRYSGAVIGLSFGTMLTITLFGYRMYRTATIFKPEPSREEFVSALNDPLENSWLVAETDRQYALKIAQQSTVEAREWLDNNKYPDHAVKGVTMDRARDLVNHFYQNGAIGVFAVNPTKEGNIVHAEIIVELPTDLAKRWQCLEDAPAGPNAGKRHPLDFGNKYVTLFGNK